MEAIHFTIEFFEELLGTASSNPEIHEEFIAKKSADKEKIEEELESLHADELLEKSMTIFPKEDGKPFVWDYQVKGFFKDACSMLRRVSKTESSKMTAYKKIIDGLVFVSPRKIILELPKGEEISSIQRPLRGQTAQGERISLANSETVPVGTKLSFDVTLLDKKVGKALSEWMEYGKLRGLGQWRNSGKGRFVVLS